MKIRTLVIDDEKLARSRLRRLLAQFDQIELIGEAENGRDGLELIRELEPDLVFLDIRMPQLTGFEMLRELDRSPYIVFTTAYDQYALKAFEQNTVDYLLKPVSAEKLQRAVSKVEQILQHDRSHSPDVEKLLQWIRDREQFITRFSVQLGDRILIIPDQEIHYFHAQDKYTFLHTGTNEYIVQFTLQELENKTDRRHFYRVHRSFIVNLAHIASIHRWFGGKLLLKMRDGREITVSRGYVKAFKVKINFTKEG